MAALAAAPPPRDVLLEELACTPRPFPLQPSPLMTPSDHCSALSFATVADQRVACFMVGGEPRLCFPQVISACLQDNDELEVTRLIQDLNIHVQSASSRQVEALKLSKALPDQVHNCGLIKKTDSERLVGELRVKQLGKSSSSPALFRPGEMLEVKHDCFGGCKGKLYPMMHPRACIECTNCGLFFSPEHFLVHNHEKAELLRTCHWGFDPSNWRMMIRLRKAQRSCPASVRAFQEFLYPTPVHAQKRIYAPIKETGAVPAKRPSMDSDYVATLLRREQLRQNDLLLQLQQLAHVVGPSSVHEATMALLKMGQPSPLGASMPSPMKGSIMVPVAKSIEPPLPTSSFTKHLALESPKKDVYNPKKEIIDVVTISDSTPGDDDEIEELKKKRAESEDSGDEDTLDSLLARHLEEPVLSTVRARIADSQRAIAQQLDEVTHERDTLRNENAALRNHYQTLFAFAQQQLSQQQQQHQKQQQQQHQHHQMGAQLSPNVLAMMSAPAKSAAAPAPVLPSPVPGSSSSTGPSMASSLASLPNSVLLQLIQQQQLQQQVNSQLAALQSIDPAILAALGVGNLQANPVAGKAVQLPTAAQLDPLRARLS